jgi:hypothetical protein
MVNPYSILLMVGVVCNICCPSAEELSSHLETDHLGSGKGSYICRWENCIRDQKQFIQRQKAIRHIRTHTGLKAYKVPPIPHPPLKSIYDSVKYVEKVSQHRRFYHNIPASTRNPDLTLVQRVINDSPRHQHY